MFAYTPIIPLISNAASSHPLRIAATGILRHSLGLFVGKDAADIAMDVLVEPEDARFEARVNSDEGQKQLDVACKQVDEWFEWPNPNPVLRDAMTAP